MTHRRSKSVKIYLVGGAVRDSLLNLPIKDKDYMVVGATPEQMLQLGYRQVGKDFPVFLHPITQQEYALARTERKVGLGYGGFSCYASPDVTLEQDLLRRDLTINAIAQDEEGNLYDPFNGIEILTLASCAMSPMHLLKIHSEYYVLQDLPRGFIT